MKQYNYDGEEFYLPLTTTGDLIQDTCATIDYFQKQCKFSLSGLNDILRLYELLKEEQMRNREGRIVVEITWNESKG